MERYYIAWNHVSHDDMNGEAISHSGIIGMKWGQRRYQYADGSWTEAGKARRRKMSWFEKRRAKKNLKKARRAAAERREKEAKRLKVVREGTAEEAYKIRNDLTNEEKQQIISRLEWDMKLKDAETYAKQQKVGKVVKAFTTAGEIARGVGSVVDTASKVRKFVNGQDTSDKKSTSNDSSNGQNQQPTKQKNSSNVNADQILKAVAYGAKMRNEWDSASSAREEEKKKKPQIILP